MQVLQRNITEQTKTGTNHGQPWFMRLSALPMVMVLIVLAVFFTWVYINTIGSTSNTALPTESITIADLEADFLYTAALVAILLASIFIMITNGVFNKYIMAPSKIEAALRFPIIGELLAEKSRRPLVAGPDSNSFFQQHFGSLYGSLNQIVQNKLNKNILITSSSSSEGKSFLAANVALGLALSGKKVALLELDFASPTLCEKFGIVRDIGIVDYLNGDASLIEIMNCTNDSLNLYVLPAGRPTKNAAALISNGGIKCLLNDLKERVDYVIIDTGIMGENKSTSLVSALCAATLVVLQQKCAPWSLIRKIKKINGTYDLRSVGIILNGGSKKMSGTTEIYKYSLRPQSEQVMLDGYVKDTI